nr:Chain C, GLU-ASP-SER-HIS-LYS-GLU-SER-ASN-ASP-CYS-SER-CYS-GLY-GLY [Homo sapiens]8EBL_D Chain D, GLU-ASP-SER-HIS-LYS-GLU-SER-ASN-ASP-CYS-SER-CYS-GLY-GLY [Homo sapiens]
EDSHKESNDCSCGG